MSNLNGIGRGATTTTTTMTTILTLLMMMTMTTTTTTAKMIVAAHGGAFSYVYRYIRARIYTHTHTHIKMCITFFWCESVWGIVSRPNKFTIWFFIQIVCLALACSRGQKRKEIKALNTIDYIVVTLFRHIKRLLAMSSPNLATLWLDIFDFIWVYMLLLGVILYCC